MKKLHFTINRECGISLINQLIDGIRKSIESGFFRPGDTLPGFREIAGETGACMVVVRQAMRRLSEQGYVVLRRGVGSVVLDTAQKKFLARAYCDRLYRSKGKSSLIRDNRLPSSGFDESRVSCFICTFWQRNFRRIRLYPS